VKWNNNISLYFKVFQGVVHVQGSVLSTDLYIKVFVDPLVDRLALAPLSVR
jgi:hypothetical protein